MSLDEIPAARQWSFALTVVSAAIALAVASDDDAVALDEGFCHSANAAGRLVVMLPSGLLYLWGGLDPALWGSAAFVATTWLLTLRLTPLEQPALSSRRPQRPPGVRRRTTPNPWHVRLDSAQAPRCAATRVRCRLPTR